MDEVLVYEVWKEGWASPDLYVYNNSGERVMLREHTLGEPPFVIFQNDYGNKTPVRQLT